MVGGTTKQSLVKVIRDCSARKDIVPIDLFPVLVPGSWFFALCSLFLVPCSLFFVLCSYKVNLKLTPKLLNDVLNVCEV